MNTKLPPPVVKNDSARKQAGDYSFVIMRFIECFINEHGYSPSLREIGKACYVSRSTVIRGLDRLEAQGYISRDIGTARSISIRKPVTE